MTNKRRSAKRNGFILSVWDSARAPLEGEWVRDCHVLFPHPWRSGSISVSFLDGLKLPFGLTAANTVSAAGPNGIALIAETSSGRSDRAGSDKHAQHSR